MQRILVKIDEHLRAPVGQDPFEAGAILDLASPEHVDERREAAVSWRSRLYQGELPNELCTLIFTPKRLFAHRTVLVEFDSVPTLDQSQHQLIATYSVVRGGPKLPFTNRSGCCDFCPLCSHSLHSRIRSAPSMVPTT